MPKRAGVTYKTAWRWWKAGQLDAYQTATGTVIVRDTSVPATTAGRIALYARISSADQKQDLDRQMQRLQDYASARGYAIAKVVQEIASGLNDHRPTRIYGRHPSKRRAERIKACIAAVMQDESE